MKLKRLNENIINDPKLDHDFIDDVFRGAIYDDKVNGWEVEDVVCGGDDIILVFYNKVKEEDYAIKFNITNVEHGIFDYDAENEHENAEFIPTKRFGI